MSSVYKDLQWLYTQVYTMIYKFVYELNIPASLQLISVETNGMLLLYI